MLGSVDEAGDDRLVLVDLMDRPLGSSTKTEVHRSGLLHRAFSVLLWRKTEQGTEILLQKRAQGKYHSGGLWTNSCCSHPRYGEELGEAVVRRLNEELGLPADAVSDTEDIGTYVYRVGLGEGQFSYTTAVNLFMSIIGFTLTYLANRLSNYLTGSGLW